MPATIAGTSGGSFGGEEEIGMLMRSIQRTPMVDVNELADADGDIVDAAFFKPRADLAISGVRTGNTGLGAAEVAGTIALTNTLPDSGVTGGQTRVLSVPSTLNAEAWQDYAINARQYPSITA